MQRDVQALAVCSHTKFVSQHEIRSIQTFTLASSGVGSSILNLYRDEMNPVHRPLIEICDARKKQGWPLALPEQT